MSKTRGFSLLEVLVAFSVLSITLGVVLNIFSLAIRTTQSAQEQQRALLLAESKMVMLSAGKFLRPGQEQGRFDNKYWWQTRIEPFDVHWMTDQEPALVPYRLSVTVGWDKQQLSLTSLRLAREVKP